MDVLRTDQHELLESHRSAVLEALLVAAAAYGGEQRLRETPEGKALLAEPRERLVSIAVSAATAAVERRRLQQEAAEKRGLVRLESSDVFPPQVLEALARRRLPFSDADVELLLDLGASTMRPDRLLGRSFETLSFALSAARRRLDEAPGSPATLAALGRAGAALDALGRAADTTGLRRRIRALLAANVPGGLLDLSIVDERDAWGPLACDALRRSAADWDRAQELLALLATATGARPTAAWRRRASDLLDGHPAASELVRELLEPILEIGLTPSGAPWPPMWLLAPQNEVLARGATWATAELDAWWVVPLLGRLALRCAAPSPHPTVTTALSQAVASGAIEALAALRTSAAEAELRMLLHELRRRDLLKRIAAIVGEPADETLARDERVRREKRRAVARKADPAVKERQRAATAYVRSDLAPALVRAGFSDSAGRTFWRPLDDRVETLHCKAHRGGLTLELGVWFRFVPRAYRVPEHEGRLRPGEFHCDLRGKVHAWHDDLASAGRKSGLWFARWRPLPVVLRWLREGTSSEEAFGWGAPGSPHQALLAGYVARELGDRGTAYAQLRRAAAFYREQLDTRRAERPADVTPEWERWVETLEHDVATA